MFALNGSKFSLRIGRLLKKDEGLCTLLDGFVDILCNAFRYDPASRPSFGSTTQQRSNSSCCGEGDEWSYPPLDGTKMHVFHCCLAHSRIRSWIFGEASVILTTLMAAGISLEG